MAHHCIKLLLLAAPRTGADDIPRLLLAAARELDVGDGFFGVTVRSMVSRVAAQHPHLAHMLAATPLRELFGMFRAELIAESRANGLLPADSDSN